MADARAVGIVGVGLLGTAVAGVLLKAGYRIVAYDVVPERVAALRARGGRGADSAAAAASSTGAVFTILPTLASVEEAISGRKGVLEGAGPETTIIQMSTISPGLAIRMEAEARARRRLPGCAGQRDQQHGGGAGLRGDGGGRQGRL